MATLWYTLDESGETQAMKVPGGIVISRTREMASGDGVAITEAICFVPAHGSLSDRKLHEWIDRVNGDKTP